MKIARSFSIQQAVAGMALGCCAAVAVLLAGCQKAEEIRQYSVAKSPLPTPTDRMLAAIVPDEAAEGSDTGTDEDGAGKEAIERGPRAWFFKILGPADRVEQATAAFDQFVASIRTGKKGLPEWTLPEGWKEDSSAQGPQFGREATIRIGEGSSQLELAVSKLPMPKDRREMWMLQNINRWRGQLQLPALARSELDEYTTKIKAGDETAIRVDFRGVYSAPANTGMLASGAHGSLPAGHPPVGATEKKTAADPVGAGSAAAAGPLPFDADVPADWQPGRMNGFRVAAYNVGGDNGAPAEVTVTPLGPTAGDLTANVNRWRNEIKLPAVKPEEIAADVKAIEIERQKADYVHLVGPSDASPREATLGVILRRPDRVWFFKMRGPSEVVETHQEQFEEYVKSVKFK